MTTQRRVTAASAGLALLLASGCTGLPGSPLAGDAARPVRAEAFSSAPVPADRQAAPAPAAATESEPGPAGADAAFGAEPVVVGGWSPAPAEGRAPAPGGLELVDAKVGDINGRPIYISSFFEPIEARLIAEAGRLSRNEWRRLAAEEIIRPRLDGLIADELLRAEALAALNPQQRQGLRAFLTGFRRDLLSENLGSEQLARRRVEAGTGRSLDEALRQKETDTLISLALFQQINRRINVSWRDIRQRYERDQHVYRPPPTARFRLIRVPTENGEAVARIAERLGAEPFEEVAADPANTFRPDEGGLHEATVEGEFAESQFFGAATLNERARALEPGQVDGPFELGSNTSWLLLEEVERTSVSLYEAQLRINQELTLERRRQEQQAYLDRLIERARVHNRDEMFLRLMRIAEERYGPKG